MPLSPRGPWHVSVTERPIELPPDASREQRHDRTSASQASSISQAASNRASEALARGSETDGTRFGSGKASAEGTPNRHRSPHRRLAFVSRTPSTEVRPPQLAASGQSQLSLILTQIKRRPGRSSTIAQWSGSIGHLHCPLPPRSPLRSARSASCCSRCEARVPIAFHEQSKGRSAGCPPSAQAQSAVASISKS